MQMVTLRSMSFKNGRNLDELYKPEILFSPKSIGELDVAAIKLQKVYNSYRTRRNLADCAVVCEELWWKALDFAALSRCSISHFDSVKSETTVSKWARARTMAAKRIKEEGKMEVLRDPECKARPLFRVTVDGGEQFNGCTPSSCWKQVFERIKEMEKGASEGSVANGGVECCYESGTDMFGFSNPKVAKLIKGLSKSKVSSKNSICKLGSRLPLGYRQVHINWFDLDKCNVCHMDEEYENNLFLQCDKCRMMV